PVDARRCARRGAGHDRRRLRALSAPARLHPADATWADRDGARPAGARGRRRQDEAVLSPDVWVPGSAEPSLEAFVSRVLMQIERYTVTHSAERTHVEVELGDGERLRSCL